MREKKFQTSFSPVKLAFFLWQIFGSCKQKKSKLRIQKFQLQIPCFLKEKYLNFFRKIKISDLPGVKKKPPTFLRKIKIFYGFFGPHFDWVFFRFVWGHLFILQFSLFCTVLLKNVSKNFWLKKSQFNYNKIWLNLFLLMITTLATSQNCFKKKKTWIKTRWRE